MFARRSVGSGRAGTPGIMCTPGQVWLACRAVAVPGMRCFAGLGIDVDGGGGEVKRSSVAVTLSGGLTSACATERVSGGPAAADGHPSRLPATWIRLSARRKQVILTRLELMYRGVVDAERTSAATTARLPSGTKWVAGTVQSHGAAFAPPRRQMSCAVACVSCPLLGALCASVVDVSDMTRPQI